MFVTREHPIAFHAAERWSWAVCKVIDSPIDVNNAEVWASHIGASKGALRCWCRAAKVSSKRSLDFARLVRAIVRSRPGEAWDLQELLNIIDERTVRSLFKRGELDLVRDMRRAPSLPDFLLRQAFITRQLLVEEISRKLQTDFGHPSTSEFDTDLSSGWKHSDRATRSVDNKKPHDAPSKPYAVPASTSVRPPMRE